MNIGYEHLEGEKFVKPKTKAILLPDYMSVRTLIEMLQKCPPDFEAIVTSDYCSEQIKINFFNDTVEIVAGR